MPHTRIVYLFSFLLGHLLPPFRAEQEDTLDQAGIEQGVMIGIPIDSLTQGLVFLAVIDLQEFVFFMKLMDQFFDHFLVVQTSDAE